MRTRYVVAIVLAVAASSGTALATMQQQPAGKRPAAAAQPARRPAAGAKAGDASGVADRRAVFDAYVEAVRASDWKKAATHFDPQALVGLHDMMTLVLEAAAKKGQEKELLQLFGGTSSVDSFAKQSSADTFAGLMNGFSASTPELKKAIAESEFQYLGEVKEKDNLVHIVYRTRVDLNGVETVKVATSSMIKTPNGWRLMLDAEIEGFAKMLHRQFAAAESTPPAPAAKTP